MELDHEFTVPVPVDQAWPVLLDVERIAPCMPGATLDSINGDEFTGRLKVKLGAMTITYRGAARIASRDETTHTVSIEGTGKEARGSGTASATVQAQLHDEGERTRVTVHTKLNVTGRPAQFGRNILSEVGGKLVGRFAGNLAEEITREPTTEDAEDTAQATAAAGDETTSAKDEASTLQVAPAEPVTGGDGTPQATPEPTPAAAAERPAARPYDDQAIDLLEFAGPSIAKRLAPVVAGLAALWALRRILRRKHR
jgi:carbon monoxide dehydrogenase subunit G